MESYASRFCRKLFGKGYAGVCGCLNGIPWSVQVADAEAFSGKMGDLQKLRVTVVILLSQENSKMLSRRQRVAGKEIEVMCAERDVEQGGATPANQERLDALYDEDTAMRQALSETETEIQKLETLMGKIDADIAALCQS